MLKKTKSFKQYQQKYRAVQQNTLYINGVMMKDDESQWLQRNYCIVCDQNFSIYKGQHHWVCGNTVCKACSQNMVNDKRTCDLCFNRIQMIDKEKLMNEQINTKRKAINEFKMQVQNEQEKNDTLKNQINEFEKQFQRQQHENKLQEKILVDQFDSKIQTIRLQIENHKRFEQIIIGEENQLEVLEQEIFDINNNIEKMKFYVILAKEIQVKQYDKLEQKKKNLEAIQQIFYIKQGEEVAQIEKNEKHESLVSTNQLKSIDQETKNIKLQKQKKNKNNCIIQ